MTYPEIDVLMRCIFFGAGALIGSFLNVCIVRLPVNASVVFPSSHCPQCKVPIRWYDNIPLVSFLALGMTCRACHKPIPWRYFFVELLTAVVFLFTYISFGLSWALVPALVLMSGLIVASCIDLEWRIIPDEISIGGMWAGLGLSVLFPVLHQGPASGVLYAGSMTAFIFVGLCMGVHLFNVFRRKASLDAEDKKIFLLGAAFLFLQSAALMLAQAFPAAYLPLAALADALQGVLIGGCSLWATGLIGEVLISKRVVTEFDFKGVVDDPRALLKALEAAGYVNDRGDLQPCFRDVKFVAALKIPSELEAKRADIFEMLQAVDEGGVMGWGDVKLLAMAGAFLGWQLALVAFFIAPFFGSAFGLVKIIRRQDSAIAYGPFLALGIAASLFWGDLVIRWVMSMYGMN